MLQGKNTLISSSIKTGLLAGVIVLFLCLVGMVESFNKRDVIEDVLTLGLFLVVATWITTGLISARHISTASESKSIAYEPILAGAISGFFAGAVLTIFVLLLGSESINLRTVFLNASPALFKVLTFEKGVGFAWLYLLYGTLAGGFGAVFYFIPPSYRKPIDQAILFCISLALFSGLLRIVLINQGPQMEKVAKYLFGQTGMTVAGTWIFFFGVIAIVAFWQMRGKQIQQTLESLPKNQKLVLRIVLIIILGYVILWLPQVSGLFVAQVIVIISLYVMMGLGLNITLGFAGLLDLGFVAFFAIGAYTVGLLTSYGPFGLQHVSFWVAVPIAVIVSMLAGFILGLPVLGVRGDYLAIATMGFGEIVRILAGSDFLAKYFGGPQGIIGIQKPCLGVLEAFIKTDIPRICDGIEIGGPIQIYYIAVAGAVLIAFVATRLRDSRLGRAWMAIREDEDVAEALGINLIQTKLLAYILGAAFAGLGGAIFSVLVGSIFASSMVLDVSIRVVALIIIGGMGSIPGVILGTIVLIGLPELLREVSDYRFLFYGALLIVMMLLKPEGLLPSTITLRELHKLPDPTTRKKAKE